MELDRPRLDRKARPIAARHVQATDQGPRAVPVAGEERRRVGDRLPERGPVAADDLTPVEPLGQGELPGRAAIERDEPQRADPVAIVRLVRGEEADEGRAGRGRMRGNRR